MKDGIILEAVSEERLNRQKLYQGWPGQSLSYVLNKFGLTLPDIDWFAYGWYGDQNDVADYVTRFAQRFNEEMLRNPSAGKVVLERVAVEQERDGLFRRKFDEDAEKAGIPHERIIYLDHHLSHAWSAFACSPFEEAYVFTLDGRGDKKSGTACFADREGLIQHDYLLSSFDGLGFLYGQVTHYLGYKPHRHEGKVTGLAAHGDPEKTLPLFRRLVDWDPENGLRCRIGFYKPFYTGLAPELIAELDKHTREDIAAGVQKHCEDLAARYVSHWIGRIGRPDVRNVCLSGGLFANVRINQVIAELPEVDTIFVFPHMGDGGLSLGAACYAQHRLTGKGKVMLPTVYLGPDYAEEEVRETLEGYGGRISFERMEDRVVRTVEDLVAERVVGYFDGRMEYGPRALGGRSILFHTRDAKVNDWLNQRLSRTEFMPFAPVTPVEYAERSYLDWKPEDVCAHFMTKTYDCTQAFREKHPAVTHVDGTARPQIVSEELNGDYYRIVKGYCDATGEWAVINTSFNMHEEPIVCSPRDAIESLLRNTIDVLVLGPFRVTVK